MSSEMAFLSDPSWPGLSRPSMSFLHTKQDVDARHKAGHDEGKLLLLRKHLSRLPERIDAGRDAGIDRDLHEDFADLVLGQPVGQRAADVQLQLVRPVEDRDHRQIEHRALLAREARTAPARAPAIFRDEL